MALARLPPAELASAHSAGWCRHPLARDRSSTRRFGTKAVDIKTLKKQAFTQMMKFSRFRFCVDSAVDRYSAVVKIWVKAQRGVRSGEWR